MDSSSISWLSEMGLDSNPAFFRDDQFEYEQVASILLGQDSSSSHHTHLVNIPSTNSITSLCTFPNPNADNSSSAPFILDFESANSILDFESANSPKRLQNADEPKRSKRAPSQTYDHIVAERKRREQLRQQFLALSTIVPGLKKTDKTSVLGDAIKYLKYLRERVNFLEEQASGKTMESVVLVNKEERALPEIEGRVCHNHILIRVHCENQKGVVTNLIDKVEKLNLAIVNTHAALVGNSTLQITVTAEMENEFKLSLNEVVLRLRAALRD